MKSLAEWLNHQKFNKLYLKTILDNKLIRWNKHHIKSRYYVNRILLHNWTHSIRLLRICCPSILFLVFVVQVSILSESDHMSKSREQLLKKYCGPDLITRLEFTISFPLALIAFTFSLIGDFLYIGRKSWLI